MIKPATIGNGIASCHYEPQKGIFSVNQLWEMAIKGLCPHVVELMPRPRLDATTFVAYDLPCGASCAAQKNGDKLRIFGIDFRGTGARSVTANVKATSNSDKILIAAERGTGGDRTQYSRTASVTLSVVPFYGKATGLSGFDSKSIFFKSTAREYTTAAIRVEAELQRKQVGVSAVSYRQSANLGLIVPPSADAPQGIQHQGNREVVDVLIYVALQEEFESLKRVLGEPESGRQLADKAITTYRFTLRKEKGGMVTVVAVMGGNMGGTRASSIMATLLGSFVPKSVVVVGISGSLTDELRLGDVILPKQISEYLANADVKDSDSGQFIFTLSQNHFTGDSGLINNCRNLQVDPAAKKRWEQWQVDSEIVVANTLASDAAHPQVRKPRVIINDLNLASGPIVVKSEQLVRFLHEVGDRKFAAVDCESHGVFDTIETDRRKIPCIAMRGISDFSDSRKSILEADTKGENRRIAMENAARFLKLAIELGAIG